MREIRCPRIHHELRKRTTCTRIDYAVAGVSQQTCMLSAVLSKQRKIGDVFRGAEEVTQQIAVDCKNCLRSERSEDAAVDSFARIVSFEAAHLRDAPTEIAVVGAAN